VSWQQLKDLCRTVGEVERSEIAQYPDGRSRGFGIVRFVHPEAASNAISQFNGCTVNGRVIEVRYDKGRP
jgi:RNA recognition motif-containing protein